MSYDLGTFNLRGKYLIIARNVFPRKSGRKFLLSRNLKAFWFFGELISRSLMILLRLLAVTLTLLEKLV